MVNVLAGLLPTSLAHPPGARDHFLPFSLPFSIQDAATLFPHILGQVLKSRAGACTLRTAGVLSPQPVYGFRSGIEGLDR